MERRDPGSFPAARASSPTDLMLLKSYVTLRVIMDAPWYVPNTVIRRDFQTPTIKEEIRHYSSQYSARLSAHSNYLIVNLIAKTPAK
jgi:hypothetical protein